MAQFQLTSDLFLAFEEAMAHLTSKETKNLSNSLEKKTYPGSFPFGILAQDLTFLIQIFIENKDKDAARQMMQLTTCNTDVSSKVEFFLSLLDPSIEKAWFSDVLEPLTDL